MRKPQFCVSDKRPIAVLTGFIFPALQYGDPHFITLDGLKYTFNGIGEYVLVTVDDGSWTLHAELTRPMTEDGLANGTIFSAFAAQYAGTDKMHIGLASDKQSKD